MIRLRLANAVPINAVNLAYVYAPAFTVKDNVRLADLSHTRVENLVCGGEIMADLNGIVDTADLELSYRSILDPEVQTPVMLFFRYRIGGGTYSVYSLAADPADLALSRSVIKRELVILDRNDDQIDIDFDLDIVATDGSTGYTVDILINSRQTEDQTFKVKYSAKAGATITPNRIEVINASSDLTTGVEYTMQEEDDGFSIQGLASSYWAPGIGVFYYGANPTGDVETLTVGSPIIRVTDDAAATHDVLYVGRTVDEVVADLNELALSEYKFVALSPCTSMPELTADTYAPTAAGTIIRLDDVVHVRYNEEIKISALKPYNDPTSKAWWPRINPGQFLTTGHCSGTGVHYLFAIPEYTGQAWSSVYGAPYRDIVDDTPEFIGPKILKLNRRSIKSGTIVLHEQGRDVSSKIQDIDLLNGVVFLTSQVRVGITADYTFEERSFVYHGIDLNPNELHNPDIIGKYVGVYLTPYKILSATIPQTFTTCVRHIVMDNYGDVVNGVTGVLFDDGSNPYAFLLGVYRSTLQADPNDIKLVDTRSRGGGLSEDIKSTDEPESAFYYDIGGSGEPFQDKGSVVVGIPNNLLGTGRLNVRMPIPAPQTGYMTPVGRLSYDYIQEAVDRHAGAGKLCILWPKNNLNANATGHVGSGSAPVDWPHPWNYAE